MKYVADTLQKKLAQAGYVVIPGVLTAAALKQQREHFNSTTLSEAPADNFGNAGAFIVADYRDPVLVELLTLPQALQILSELGFPRPKLHNYYVSTKPPGAQALAWHSDLFYAYEKPEPAELFLIYYLQDTTPANGCLRVVPGSHAWPKIRREAGPHDAMVRPGEVDVPIQAGDLFLGDRRLLHATHANNSDTWRTCITIAYAPSFDTLSEPIQARIVQNQCLPPKGWWQTDAKNTIDPRLQAILPIYDGGAQPIAIDD